jgi:hypothetical protein
LTFIKLKVFEDANDIKRNIRLSKYISYASQINQNKFLLWLSPAIKKFQALSLEIFQTLSLGSSR